MGPALSIRPEKTQAESDREGRQIKQGAEAVQRSCFIGQKGRYTRDPLQSHAEALEAQFSKKSYLSKKKCPAGVTGPARRCQNRTFEKRS